MKKCRLKLEFFLKKKYLNFTLIQPCRRTFFCLLKKRLFTAYMFLLALAFKSDEKASYYEHYPSILVSFVRKTEHFSVKNRAF